ncbi:MAG: hypothetical protein AAB037_03910, partial [Chloroflexota bacterium]
MLEEIVAPEQLIADFRVYILTLLREYQPDFIVPLESKGTMLAEICLPDKVLEEKVIYPRAFDYIKLSKLTGSKFLLVDDNVKYGTTAYREISRLRKKGVPDKQIEITSLLDSSNPSDPQLPPDLKQLLRKIRFGPGASRLKDEYSRAALFYLQDKILQKKIPLAYDHLRLTARIDGDQYWKFLDLAQDAGRLLDYSKHGGYLTSAILIDDLYTDVEWDFPPEFRLWFHLDTGQFQIAPIGTPLPKQTIISKPHETSLYNQVLELFRANLNVLPREQPEVWELEAIAKADFHAKSLASRTVLLPRIKSLLNHAQIAIIEDLPDFRKYYPDDFGKQLAQLVWQFWNDAKSEPLPPYRKIETASTPPHRLSHGMAANPKSKIDVQQKTSAITPPHRLLRGMAADLKAEYDAQQKNSTNPT